jgi:DNA polymerase-3 subunit beta
LSEKIVTIENNIVSEKLKEKRIIIPAKTIQELLRIISNENEDEDKNIIIYFSDNQVLFSFGPVELISRTISGQYPDYEQIIPKKFNSKAVLNRQELIRAIKASSIFSRDGINDVNVEIKNKNKEVLISSFSGQNGESNINIEAKIEGEDVKIKLNYKYLLEGLNNIKDENIIIQVVDENLPCLVEAENNNNYIYIIMPIKQ